MEKFIQGIEFCQIFRWNSYPEIPGGYPEPESDLVFKNRNRIGTGTLITGTGSELPICYPGTPLNCILFKNSGCLAEVKSRGMGYMNKNCILSSAILKNVDSTFKSLFSNLSFIAHKWGTKMH